MIANVKIASSLQMILFVIFVVISLCKGQQYVQAGDYKKDVLEFGMQNLSRKDWSAAIENYLSVIHNAPTNALAYNGLGLAYFGEGDLSNALSNFSKSLSIDSSNFVVYCNRAEAYRMLFQYNNALEDYNHCLSLSSNYPPAYRGRAALFSCIGNCDKAVDDISCALQNEPNNSTNLLFRADLYSRIGRGRQAIADYNRAIMASVNNPDAYNDYAWFLATCSIESYRNVDQAIKLSTHSCELVKWQNWRFIDTLAVAYAQSGNFDSAVKYESLAATIAGVGGDARSLILTRLSMFKKHHSLSK